MARDWGFHHTATANLARIQGAAAVEPEHVGEALSFRAPAEVAA